MIPWCVCLVQHPGMSCIFIVEKLVNFNVFSGKSLEHPRTPVPSKDGLFATLRLHALEALTWSQLTYLWRHWRFCSAVPIRIMLLGRKLQTLSSSLLMYLWRRIILVDLSLSYIVMLIARCHFFGCDIWANFQHLFNQKTFRMYLHGHSWRLTGKCWLHPGQVYSTLRFFRHYMIYACFFKDTLWGKRYLLFQLDERRALRS